MSENREPYISDTKKSGEGYFTHKQAPFWEWPRSGQGVRNRLAGTSTKGSAKEFESGIQSNDCKSGATVLLRRITPIPRGARRFWNCTNLIGAHIRRALPRPDQPSDVINERSIGCKSTMIQTEYLVAQYTDINRVYILSNDRPRWKNITGARLAIYLARYNHRSIVFRGVQCHSTDHRSHPLKPFLCIGQCPRPVLPLLVLIFWGSASSRLAPSMTLKQLS